MEELIRQDRWRKNAVYKAMKRLSKWWDVDEIVANEEDSLDSSEPEVEEAILYGKYTLRKDLIYNIERKKCVRKNKYGKYRIYYDGRKHKTMTYYEFEQALMGEHEEAPEEPKESEEPEESEIIVRRDEIEFNEEEDTVFQRVIKQVELGYKAEPTCKADLSRLAAEELANVHHSNVRYHKAKNVETNKGVFGGVKLAWPMKVEDINKMNGVQEAI